MATSIFVKLRAVYNALFRFVGVVFSATLILGLFVKFISYSESYFLGTPYNSDPDFNFVSRMVLLLLLMSGIMFGLYKNLYIPIKEFGFFSDEFVEFGWTTWWKVLYGEMLKASAFVVSIFLASMTFIDAEKMTPKSNFILAGVVPTSLIFIWLLNVSIRYAYFCGTQDKSDVSMS